MGHDVTDFEREVVQRSQELPVLVDFWAPWCGPCRALTPVLERLAASAAGRWLFAKVNVDEHPDLAEKHQVSGIPAVKLFIQGSAVEGFVGVKSEKDILRFIHQHLPSPHETDLKHARALMEEQRFPEASACLRTILEAEPSNDAARVALAECCLSIDPAQVAATLAPISIESPVAEKAGALRTLCRFAALIDNSGSLGESPVKPRYLQAAAALRSGDYAAALEGFIDVLSRRRDYDQHGAKVACQAIFLLLGIRHPLAEKYHRAFSSALHS